MCRLTVRTRFRLNERQVALLHRIAEGDQPVTSRESELARSVYALRDRGLVAMPRSRRQDPTQRRRPRPSVSAQELLQQLTGAGGPLTIANPDAATRAAWRRAIHAARAGEQRPDGQRPQYSGRDHGALVVRLLPDTPATKSTLPEPVLVPERPTRPHSVVATLKQAPGRLSVSSSCLGRALRIIHPLPAKPSGAATLSRPQAAREARCGWLSVGTATS